MRLDDNLNYSPKHVYRVPGRVRYTTKLALDARYGEGRWVAPYAPIIEGSPAIEFEEGGRADFIREGVRPGDVGIAREISTQIALYGNVFVAPEPRTREVIEELVRVGLVSGPLRGKRADQVIFDEIQSFYVEYPGDFREAPVSGVATVDFDVTPDGEKVSRGT